MFSTESAGKNLVLNRDFVRIFCWIFFLGSKNKSLREMVRRGPSCGLRLLHSCSSGRHGCWLLESKVSKRWACQKHFWPATYILKSTVFGQNLLYTRPQFRNCRPRKEVVVLYAGKVLICLFFSEARSCSFPHETAVYSMVKYGSVQYSTE